MKIMVAGDFHQAWRAPAWAEGLRRLGIDVSEHSWMGDYSAGLTGYLERRFLLGPGIAIINERLINEVRRIEPDIVLVYAGRPILTNTIRALARICPVAGYDNDDPFGRWRNYAYFRHYASGLSAYTCHHVFREVNVDDFTSRGCTRVRVLAPFYLPWIHRPSDPADLMPELSATVVFVGNGQPGTRSEYVAALVDAGVQTRVFGDPRYWRRYLPGRIFRALSPIAPVTGAAYARVLSSAALCLGLFSEGNRDQYTVRSFEIPACTGMLLAHRTPWMTRTFSEGEQAEYFSSAAELVAKARWYLRKPLERRRIAAAGHARCIADGHDVASRMGQWLADVRSWGLVH